MTPKEARSSKRAFRLSILNPVQTQRKVDLAAGLRDLVLVHPLQFKILLNFQWGTRES